MDINIFMSFFGLAVILGVIGIWKKIPLTLFIGGALVTFLSITPVGEGGFTDGNRIESIDTVGDTSIINWEPDPIGVDTWTLIFFAVLGAMFMLAGAVIWKQEED